MMQQIIDWCRLLAYIIIVSNMKTHILADCKHDFRSQNCYNLSKEDFFCETSSWMLSFLSIGELVLWYNVYFPN